ncbi:hypothetical protein FRC96_18195 [Lujinxingia vulgaris]|uniref:Uncharacterized protein n=1 Tax=Lujinxingia vulgaris TaxID=2600176 RepID=A0A5C6X0M1_9DELT|nr:hypothetical protein [Lujinxingia vulgaris]TXD32256.1 hypothetical protein FRC96_18195 [Lujinxingia vulgaris]
MVDSGELMIVGQSLGWGIVSLLVGLALGVGLVVNIWRERKLLRVDDTRWLEDAARELKASAADVSEEASTSQGQAQE